MSLNDPFFAVKNEVQKTLTQAKAQYQQWRRASEGHTTLDRTQSESARSELKTSLRNIELDLEDLEETIGVVEQNPRRFQLTDAEVRERRQFVERTKTIVKDMRDNLTQPISSDKKSEALKEEGVRQALLGNANRISRGLGLSNRNKYTRLGTEDDDTDDIRNSPGTSRYTRIDQSDSQHHGNDEFVEYELNQNQQMVLRTQDETLDKMGSSVSILKGMSRQIGNELDEQSIMLDEFSHEMESTDSKLDSNMKKIAKVLHMSNDRRQWTAIGVLALALFIVILLLIVLK